ncbi:sugar phosphate isomerase/epimerase family protein [Lederbergia wuyishanensis]|uniref:Sugar phosphate isomerase/epimerase n=1 Tax=Lederbergia wuyishanensis TaxID=1347903 RepID=A0ABU0D0B5_9BACI|nr:sugar phosphate isomerase/epimerase family protein [Lederbergia wuyishanensis]MCJ8006468.1 sugar phosphate isomerase/epimerase [Lederbergia wuyishanensis]MDQ0341844.1 sugar phosphate isomerase/epimerase [Lederbergia wuyishanensis]
MDVGVVSRSFPQLSNEETAKLLSEKGFKWTELCFSQTDSNYWVYNGMSDMKNFTDEESIKIVESFRNEGIEVSAIGVFTNLLETNEKEAEENLAYFERLIEIASINNVPYVSTECGFIPGKRGVNADTYEADFQRILENVKYLAQKAEKYKVSIAIEPCVLDIIPSAKRMVDFINQVGSDRVKVLLDPANLIANNSEEDMFSYLSPHIAYFHGKDRKVNDTYGRAIGDGDINWPLFLHLYHKYTEDVPFIMEYVNINNFCDIRDRVLHFNEMAAFQYK